jgi:hypothetical protein
MPRMNILNAVEREAFDSPPVFNSFQRKQYFDFPSTPIRRWPPAVRPGGSCKLLIKNCIICSASMTSRTRSCETASEFDPQNWWTKWGAILGVAQSPKIQSIKGDKRNGHLAFGTFVGI